MFIATLCSFLLDSYCFVSRIRFFLLLILDQSQNRLRKSSQSYFRLKRFCLLIFVLLNIVFQNEKTVNKQTYNFVF